MKLKRWLPWLVLAYLITLLVLLPARVIYWMPLPNNIQLTQVSGTLWQGAAGQVVVDGNVINDLSWNWQVSSIFLGDLVVDVKVPKQNNPFSLQGRLLASSTRIGAQNIKASGSLGALLDIAQTKLPLQTKGRWELDVSEYVVTAPGPVRWCDNLEGSASGDNIQVLVNGQWQSLGSFPVELGCHDDNSVALIMKGDNDLSLEVDASINSQDIKASGTVKPTPRTPEGLAKLIQYMGQPDAQGRYSFRL